MEKKKRSKQGFASPKYNQALAKAVRAKGGRAKVAKGFAKMSPEKRREIAMKGGRKGRRILQ